MEVITDGKKKVKAGSFQSMGLLENILKGLNRMHYTEPTPVQRKALPIVLAGLDVVCMARTGSGKTCVFLLPLVQKLESHQSAGVRALVLSPTRELAVQTFKFAKDMAKFTDLRIASILGGDSIEGQFDQLASKPDVIIATPGRLMHHLREVSTFKLKSVRYLVFDEADRLFEMGFAEQLNEIVRGCPKERQTLLFSATLPKLIVQFSRAGLKDPQLIRLDTDIKMSDELRMGFFLVRSSEKLAALLYFVRNIIPDGQKTIIFTATRHHSEMIYALLTKINISCTQIYGSMDQEARNMNLKKFRQGTINYMVVTDVAARGIDVPLLNNVINFHFPTAPKLFVHRCGRAARQGRIGFAFSLIDPEEMAYMMDVHQFLGKQLGTGYPAVSATVTDNTSLVPQNNFTINAAYTFQTMTPEMIHTGLLPQDVIEEENDFLKRLLREDDTFSTLFRISENGMQQYRRTRGEASREGVKNAKKVIKSDEVINIHPLLVGVDAKHCNPDVISKSLFIRTLQTFRPAQTVFETGIGTGCTSSKHNSMESKTNKSKKAAEFMQAFRRATVNALERNKKLLKEKAAAAKSASLTSLKDDDDDGLEHSDDEYDVDDNEEEVDENEEEVSFSESDNNSDSSDDEGGNTDKVSASNRLKNRANKKRRVIVKASPLETSSIISDTSHLQSSQAAKKRLSAAERRKLKKYGTIITTSTSSNGNEDDDTANNTSSPPVDSNSNNQYNDHNVDFQDGKYYMSYGTENTHETFAEETSQPLSNLRSSEMFCKCCYYLFYDYYFDLLLIFIVLITLFRFCSNEWWAPSRISFHV